MESSYDSEDDIDDRYKQPVHWGQPPQREYPDDVGAAAGRHWDNNVANRDAHFRDDDDPYHEQRVVHIIQGGDSDNFYAATAQGSHANVVSMQVAKHSGHLHNDLDGVRVWPRPHAQVVEKMKARTLGVLEGPPDALKGWGHQPGTANWKSSVNHSQEHIDRERKAGGDGRVMDEVDQKAVEWYRFHAFHEDNVINENDTMAGAGYEVLTGRDEGWCPPPTDPKYKEYLRAGSAAYGMTLEEDVTKILEFGVLLTPGIGSIPKGESDAHKDQRQALMKTAVREVYDHFIDNKFKKDGDNIKGKEGRVLARYGHHSLKGSWDVVPFENKHSRTYYNEGLRVFADVIRENVRGLSDNEVQHYPVNTKPNPKCVIL